MDREINTTGESVPRREEVRDVSAAGDWKRNYVRVVQGEISRANDERDQPLKEEIDLRFLGDLGSLVTSDSKDHDDLDTFPNEEAFKCRSLPSRLWGCIIVESVRSNRSSDAAVSAEEVSRDDTAMQDTMMFDVPSSLNDFYVD